MDDFILILTNAKEQTVRLVTDYLDVMREKYIRFNTEHFPSSVLCSLKLKGGQFSFKIAGREYGIPKSVWYRRPLIDKTISSSLSEVFKKFVEDETKTALWSLYTNLDTFWVNPPLIGHSLLEHNKLYQMRIARRYGLDTPSTIVSNDADEIIAFCESHGGKIAIKTLRGHVLMFPDKTGEMTPHLIYTNLVTSDQLRQRKREIQVSPMMIQEYIEKQLELRITVVGDQIFACAIHSQDSVRTRYDWRRYDFKNVVHEPYVLPMHIQENILNMMRGWQLVFGAIDMILTPDGRYIFLEVNPHGQWGWIEGLTKLPISKAIAKLLSCPTTL